MGMACLPLFIVNIFNGLVLLRFLPSLLYVLCYFIVTFVSSFYRILNKKKNERTQLTGHRRSHFGHGDQHHPGPGVPFAGTFLSENTKQFPILAGTIGTVPFFLVI